MNNEKEINLLKYNELLQTNAQLKTENEQLINELRISQKIIVAISKLNSLLSQGANYYKIKDEIHTALKDIFNVHHSDIYITTPDNHYLLLEKEQIKKEYLNEIEHIFSYPIPDTIKISLTSDNWYAKAVKNKKTLVSTSNSDIESMIRAFLESNYPNIPYKQLISKTIAIFKKSIYTISIPIFYEEKNIALLDVNFHYKPNNKIIEQIEFFSSEIAVILNQFNIINTLKQVTSKITDVVWLMDLTGKSIFVTDSVTSFTGYTKEEYLNQTIQERFTPNSAKIAIEALYSEIASFKNMKEVPKNYSKTLTLDYLCKDGKIKTGEVSITPYFNKKGECIGIHGVTHDITHKVEAEKKYQEMFENIQDIIYKVDFEGKIIEINPYFEKISGYKVKDFIGKPITDLYWNPEDRKLFLDEITKTGKVTNYKLKLKSKNNEIVYSLTSSRIIYNQNNEPLYIEGVVHIITDIVLANQKIQGLSQIIENSRNEIYIFDYETLKFYFANKEALKNLQYTEQEIFQLTPLDLKPDLSLHDFNKLLEPLRNGEKDKIYFETTHLRKDGTKYPVSVYVQLSTYYDKKVFNTIILDISELQKQKESVNIAEKKWETIFNGLTHPTLILDKNQNILEANEVLLNKLGKTKEEVRKMKCWDVFYGKKCINQPNHCPFLITLQTKSDNNITMIMKAFGGYSIVTCTPLFDKNGEIENIIHISTDITEQKKAEELLRYNNEVLQQLNDFSYNLTLNSNFNNFENYIVKTLKEITHAQFVTFNEYNEETQLFKLKSFQFNQGLFEKIFNLIGKKAQEIVVPLSKEMYEKMMSQNIGHLKTINEATFGSIPSTVGTIIDNMLHIDQYVALVFKFEDKLYGTALIAIKKGTLVLSDEIFKSIINIISALLKQHTYQRKLIETKEIAQENEKIVTLQKNEIELQNERLESLLRIAKFNNNNIQELLDYSLNEAIKLTNSKIGFLYFYDDQKQEFILNSWSKEVMNECKVLNPQTIYSLEKTGLWGEVVRQKKPIVINNYNENNPYKKGTPDGHVKLNKFLSIPIFIDNKIVATIGVANKETDYQEADIRQLTLLMDNVWKITERITLIENLRAAKEKAEESDRLKSAFLANVSHEIRTPMNAILGFAEILKNHKLSNADQQKYFQIIENSGQRMLNIINDIIDISKIEAGLVKVNISKIDLNEQLAYIYNFFKPEAEQKGLLLEVNNHSNKNNIIETDKEKLLAILINLIKNAIKYTEQGYIKLNYTQNNSSIEFKIEDTGIGIPKNRQDAVFERFVQADINDKMAKQGAGLGLSITKAYIEMLGGTIWFESEEQKGTTFFFTLPIKNTKEITEIKAEIIESPTTTTKKKKINILIVEDDEHSMLLLSVILKEYGDNIFKAVNGFDAIKLLKSHPEIKLVFMDIGLPDLTGLETVEKIRQFNKEVIIIAQTAYGFLSDKEKALKSGCNDYISKPIKKENIVMLIEKYFN